MDRVYGTIGGLKYFVCKKLYKILNWRADQYIFSWVDNWNAMVHGMGIEWFCRPYSCRLSNFVFNGLPNLAIYKIRLWYLSLSLLLNHLHIIKQKKEIDHAEHISITIWLWERVRSWPNRESEISPTDKFWLRTLG